MGKVGEKMKRKLALLMSRQYLSTFIIVIVFFIITLTPYAIYTCSGDGPMTPPNLTPMPYHQHLVCW
jgi:hypothetical protein